MMLLSLFSMIPGSLISGSRGCSSGSRLFSEFYKASSSLTDHAVLQAVQRILRPLTCHQWSDDVSIRLFLVSLKSVVCGVVCVVPGTWLPGGGGRHSLLVRGYSRGGGRGSRRRRRPSPPRHPPSGITCGTSGASQVITMIHRITHSDYTTGRPRLGETRKE